MNGAAVALLAVVGLLGGCSEPSDPKADLSSGPTYTEHVAAILLEHCGDCHRPDGVAPFSLLTYQDARRRAKLIHEVTQSGYMPRWLPEPGYGDFRDARRLSPDELSTLAEWATSDLPRGPGRLLADAVPDLGEWALGEPDLVLSMPEAFLVPADGPDIFRNFLVPLNAPPGARVRAMQFLPGNLRVVHHAAVLTDTSGAARRLEALDPLPGYVQMVGGSAPGGHFVGWTPGRGAAEFEAGMPWQIEDDADLVFQLHLLPSGREESVRASVGLYFTDEESVRRPTSLHLLATTLDIPPGEPNYRAEDELVLPVDVEILAVYPHAHYLGKEIKASATLPDGRVVPLLWIREWDFDWQDQYSFQEPILLPAGTRIHLALTYDNSADNVRNPHDPPRRVIWGPSSLDEMGDLWIKAVTVDPSDLPSLDRFLAKRSRDRYRRGYQIRAAFDPDDGDAQARLGIGFVQDGRFEDSLPHLRRALDSQPDAWDVRYNLATALVALGRRRQGLVELRRALEVNPGDSKTHNSIGGSMLLDGDFEQAVVHFRKALESRPENADLRTNLGLALARSKQPEAAVQEYRRALDLDADNVNAHLNFGVLLSTQGRLREAERQYRAVLRLDNVNLQAVKNLARTLNQLGSVEEARALLAAASRRESEDAELHHFLGLTLLRLERMQEALVELSRAVAIAPELSAAREDLGLLLVLEGRSAEALQQLKIATGPGEPSAELHYRTGLALMGLGRWREAATELEAALEKDASHGEARQSLAEVRRRM